MSERGGLPHFLVIGAMKTGTTTLHHVLRGHPAIHVPADKELNFFVAEHNWHHGVDWYRDQFRRAQPGAVLGEASPDYSKFPHYAGVPERIASVVPEVRLVYVVREPVARIRSHYRHQVGAGREQRPIDVAVLEDPRYVDASRYSMQLGRYLEEFDEAQLLVLTSDDLRADPVSTAGAVFDHLGIEPLDDLPAEEWNRSDQIGRRRPLARVAGRLPFSHQIVERLPKRLRARLRRVAYEPVPPGVSDLSPEVEARLREELRDDVLALARWAPDAPARWGYE